MKCEDSCDIYLRDLAVKADRFRVLLLQSSPQLGKIGTVPRPCNVQFRKRPNVIVIAHLKALLMGFLVMCLDACKRPVKHGTSTCQNLACVCPKATYFDPNGGYGACGPKIQNGDLVAALG